MCHIVATAAAAAVCRLVDGVESWQAHPVGVVQAVDGALSATGLVLFLPDGHDPHHQLLLHLLHLLLLGLLGLHLVDHFCPSDLELIACFLRGEASNLMSTAPCIFPLLGKHRCLGDLCLIISPNNLATIIQTSVFLCSINAKRLQMHQFYREKFSFAKYNIVKHHLMNWY